MGSGSFDHTASAARASMRASTGASAFVHTAAISAGTAVAAIHDTLNLANKPYRECRDNPDNPVSVPIGVVIDVTGSMGRIADLIIADLNKLVPAIRDRGVVKNPSLCFGAVGDARCDSRRGCFQLGEFEASDELAEQHLGNIWKTDQGGGTQEESYDLPMYFFANHVQTDHWDNRGEKGFLFIIGDERYYNTTTPKDALEFCGINLEADIPIEATAAKLQERWHTFILRPGQTNNFDDPKVDEAWARLFSSERVMKLEDWHDIVPMIAGTISVMSGEAVDAAIKAAKDSGLDVSATTTGLLAKLAEGGELVAAGIGSSGAGTSERT